jgi:arylformamidase
VTLYDISRPIRRGLPVWPGDVPFELDWNQRLEEGDAVNLSAIRMSVHAGTHADAPYHFQEGGSRIAEVDLDAYLGRARVAALEEGATTITAEWVERVLAGEPVERLLIRTGSWRDPDSFPEDFTHFEPEAARRIAGAGVRLVGTDAPSVDPLDSKDLPAHHALGGGGVLILESLLLDGVPEGEYDLVALPLRLEEGDGSPIRAVLRA